MPQGGELNSPMVQPRALRHANEVLEAKQATGYNNINY